MRGNLGLKLQNSPKLLQSHTRWKGLLSKYWYLGVFKRDGAILQKENHTSNEKQKQNHKMKNWCYLLSCAYWKVAS